MVNKPQKPDYSVPKAYRPIALMECTGKLLEKIVAKHFNLDIEQHNLLPMSQFGFCPNHNAIDAAACLVHKIQSTLKTGHVAALLLFDILGFFDNINPKRATAILHNLGFLTNVCDWTHSFLTGREASIRLENYISTPFPILNGTPQGSPLSPILSALYTSSFLLMVKEWKHSDLTLYVDNRAIFSISAMMSAAAEKARLLYEKVLSWLGDNGLRANPDKNELMIFSKRHSPNLTGPRIWGTRYNSDTHTNHISTIQSLRYLGLYISPKLDWTRHVTIMAHRARSTIRGIGLLGNSIYGLDLLNWRKVYNALIIPTLTYGVPVWYTGTNQKSLIQ
jgi:hypothetical protein